MGCTKSGIYTKAVFNQGSTVLQRMLHQTWKHSKYPKLYNHNSNNSSHKFTSFCFSFTKWRLPGTYAAKNRPPCTFPSTINLLPNHLSKTRGTVFLTKWPMITKVGLHFDSDLYWQSWNSIWPNMLFLDIFYFSYSINLQVGQLVENRPADFWKMV